MRRREFITLLGGAAVAWPIGARAQQVEKIYRIGILEPIPAARNAANLDALRKGLRELGYVEGRNLVIEYRSADGRAERFPDLASELVRLKVDLRVYRWGWRIFSPSSKSQTCRRALFSEAKLYLMPLSF